MQVRVIAVDPAAARAVAGKCPHDVSHLCNLLTMGRLTFSFGTMSSGKSTLALQIHHNLSATSTGLLCSMHDRAGAHVSSALGVSTPAVEVHPELDFVVLANNHQAAHGALDYLVCDEAQFYTDLQVEQLACVVDELDVDVYAFGLLTDFRGKLFPGSARLLELADERMELQVQARCWCGEAATHNARLHDGVQIYDGDVVLIDDGSIAQITYELRCRSHWISGDAGPVADRFKAAG
ncbi:MAG: thymidine kinase [Acidimicrobiales bacterium]|nr:thymidine kinase [Acidimicrobiales bacterium]